MYIKHQLIFMHYVSIFSSKTQSWQWKWLLSESVIYSVLCQFAFIAENEELLHMWRNKTPARRRRTSYGTLVSGREGHPALQTLREHVCLDGGKRPSGRVMAVHALGGGSVPPSVLLRKEVREGSVTLTLQVVLMGLRQQVRDGATKPNVSAHVHFRDIPALWRRRGGRGKQITGLFLTYFLVWVVYLYFDNTSIFAPHTVTWFEC